MDESGLIYRVVYKQLYLFAYPIILILGLVLRVILPSNLYTALKESYWVSSGNLINRIFANNGLNVFTVIYILAFTGRVLVELHLLKHQPILPTSEDEALTDRPLRRDKIRPLIVRYVLIYCVIYVLVLVFQEFKDAVNYMTGGGCTITEEKAREIASSLKSVSECQKFNGVWDLESERCQLTGAQLYRHFKSSFSCLKYGSWTVGSFNISGHFNFIGTISTLAVYEMSPIVQILAHEDLPLRIVRYLQVVLAITFVTVYIWMSMLLVTALFYHTIIEKILGLGFGYFPLIITTLIDCYLSSIIIW